MFGERAWEFLQQSVDFSEKEKSLLGQMLKKQINAPLTASAGRLFDAVASLTGLRQRASFEGQAAMELEFGRQLDVRDAYTFRIEQARPIKVGWGPTIRELLADVGRQKSGTVMAVIVHH